MNYITAHKMYKQAKAENLRASLGQGRGLGPGKGRIDGTGLAHEYPSDSGSTDSVNVAATTFASAALSGALGGGVALLFNAMGGNLNVPSSAISSAALGGGLALMSALEYNKSRKTDLKARTPNLSRKGIRV